MFYGRENERAFLQGQFERREAALVVVYGRRRIGKTTLLEKFAGNKKQLYFLATEESEQANFDKFCAIAADVLTDNIFLELRSDWEMAFKLIAEKSVNERVVVVLDEFQYLCSANSAFSSIIQRCWDGFLKNANIMLILCGSHIGMMESQTLNYTSPLYGRRTGQIRLKQLAYAEMRPVFADDGAYARILRYSVCGGVPKYAEAFIGRGDLLEQISRDVLDKNGFLYEEPFFLLSKELTSTGNYFSLLKTIAAGDHKIGNIASKLNTMQSQLTKYLKVLIDMDIIERRVPVTESDPSKSKRGLYYITDNFLEFWFKFVYPRRDELETFRKQRAMTEIAKYLPERLAAFVYEDVCIQYVLSEKFEQDTGLFFERAGRWWSGNEEIDVVGIAVSEKKIFIAECKYRELKLSRIQLDTIVSKLRIAEINSNFAGDFQKIFAIFSVNGFEPDAMEFAQVNNIMLFYGDCQVVKMQLES
ncbi:MAG: ATP-binding protein [Bacillota bacterium]